MEQGSLQYPLNNNDQRIIEKTPFDVLNSLQFKGGLPVLKSTPTYVGVQGEIVELDTGTLYVYINGVWKSVGGFTSRARAYLGTNQTSIASGGSGTKVLLDTVNFDGLTEFDAVTNHRFVAQSAGYYQVNAQIYWQGTVDQTLLGAIIKVNGGVIATKRIRSSGTADQTVEISDIVYMAAGGYIELFAYQASGSPQNIFGVSDGTFLSIHRLS
jgi:hypothetical protein